MAPSIGLNLRVTGYKHQGGRRYMEDDFGVAYQQTADEKDLEYAFFGIFDGHGGREAAVFAKEHLMDFIVSQKGFWEDDDDAVLKAIHEGFIQTHYAMWKELEKWPKTASGLPSTAGTTASIAFIRRGKIYIGHVGDSAIVLGVQDPDNPDVWRADPLTIDHKPESLEESERIQQCGGKVVCKSGVPRVVWNRPKMGHKGPVRRSTHIDEIPFLAVARSLGDLWSYNSEENVFVVSPEPDIRVYPVDITKHRCLILGTDGAWNMLTPQNAISTVCQAEKANEQHMLNPVEGKTAWINPSKKLVDTAIERWSNSKLRADNTSVVTVMLDPPGPPRSQVLKNRKRELTALNEDKDLQNSNLTGDSGSVALVTNTTQDEQSGSEQKRIGCSIISRFPNSPHPGHSVGYDLVKKKRSEAEQETPPRDFRGFTGRLSDSTLVKTSTFGVPSTSKAKSRPAQDDNVQCNEVSSSEDSPSRNLVGGPSKEPVSEKFHQADSSPLSKSHEDKSAPGHAKKDARKSLSRELNSLQISNPRPTRGSTISRTRSEKQVDNRLSSVHTPQRKPGTPAKLPQKSLSFVKQRAQEINAKIEKSEKKSPPSPRPVVKKTLSLLKPDESHNLRSASMSISTPRLCRSSAAASTPINASAPRNAPASAPSNTPASAARPRSAVKRKLPAVLDGSATKSPRTAEVSSKKPVVTRSRQATVLKLKK